jgi:hypothetical protein
MHNNYLDHNRDSAAIVAVAVIVPFISILLLVGVSILIVTVLYFIRTKRKPGKQQLDHGKLSATHVCYDLHVAN